MDALKTYGKLLKFMYDESDKGPGRNELILVLIQQFQRSPQGCRLGDALDQVEAVRYLITKGWIGALDPRGNKLGDPTRAYSIGRVQLTQRGRVYLQQGQFEAIPGVFRPIAKAFRRLFKGSSGY